MSGKNQIIEPETVPFSSAIYSSADFPGGNDAFYRYLNKNLKYPDSARKYNIQGKVRVAFYIDVDGSIINAEVRTPLGYGLDEEALKLINQMPKWIPAKENGKPKKTFRIIPLKFELH